MNGVESIWKWLSRHHMAVRVIDKADFGEVKFCKEGEAIEPYDVKLLKWHYELRFWR